MERMQMYFTGIPVISSDLAVKTETREKKWRRPGRPTAQPKTCTRTRYTPQAYFFDTLFDGKIFLIHPSIVKKMEEEFLRQDMTVDGRIKYEERTDEMKDLFTDLRKKRYSERTTTQCGPGMRMESSDQDINLMLAEFKKPEWKDKPIDFKTRMFPLAPSFRSSRISEDRHNEKGI